MRGQSACAVCCGGLCQHPECWRSNIQQVREAVWRRNGVKPHGESHESDGSCLQKEQHIDSRYGDLPTLKIVDLFSDLDAGVQNTSRKYLMPIHQRSSSLPCLPSAVVSQESIFSPPRSPRQSLALTSPPLTEYQRQMKWKKQFDCPSRIKTASDSVKMSTIGVHEIYEDDELDQEWQEVYVTSAYLVWCPSNKKGRKAKRNSSKRNHRNKVIPKDVTEDLVPASMETTKQCRPKSTKTPTGGQPFSPHKPVTNPALCQYGMEDLLDLPKPVLSGILKRINWRSNEGTPGEEQEETKEPDAELFPSQQEGSKMLLAVDINSRFTTPEDEEAKGERDVLKEKPSIINETTKTVPFQTEDLNDVKQKREILSMHSIGLPIDDLPEPKHHHCTNSIPRRMSLGVALEPVNLVPITPSPAPTPKQSSQHDVITDEVQQPDEQSLIVTVPSGRPESAPMHTSLDVWDKFQDQYYVNTAFRYTPSPVRAPAPTPISPEKYSEFARYSRTSRRRSSSQDEQILKSMRRWNTLSSVYDSNDTKCADKEALSEKNGFLEGGGVFLTEGVTDEIDKMALPTPRCRSPSPGSMTCIPRDIIEQFQGDIYGRRYPKAEIDENLNRKASTHIGTGIVAPGWRPPRSRTPIQLSETPARYPPRPLRQPPLESIPKSLQIISIPKQQRFRRPRSTPPRTNTPNDNDLVPLILSESSLVNQSAESAISLEVQGPSSHSTDPGAIPPPPSPEATLALKNELQPSLETLCEEDERSSRNTSIVDVIEKEMPLSRLSPLGGGSEISDESVDLPVDLNDVEQSNQEEQDNIHTKNIQPQFDQIKLEGLSQQQPKEMSCEQYPKVSSERDPDKVFSEQHPEVSLEPHPEVSLEPHPEVFLEPHPEMSSEPHPEVSCEPHPEVSYETHSEVSCETHSAESEHFVPRPKQVSPELHPQQDSHEPNNSDFLEIEIKTDLPQDLHQPPGSPDVTSNQDFTEGIDMELDLAAELQAAMEGLGDFDIDDINEDDYEH